MLSVVVYTGRKGWDAKCSVRELLTSLPGESTSDLPIGFLPDSYVVVDAQSYSSSDLVQDENPVSALFQAEKSRGFEELRRAVIKADELLPESKYRVLRRDLARVFRDVLIPAKAPGTEIEEVDNLTEVATMLQESVIEWREGWRAEGQKEGEAKGRKEGEARGRKEGEASVLIRQAELKYGPLPGWALARIESADADQLLIWAERILTARTLDEIFEL